MAVGRQDLQKGSSRELGNGHREKHFRPRMKLRAIRVDRETLEGETDKRSCWRHEVK